MTALLALAAKFGAGFIGSHLLKNHKAIGTWESALPLVGGLGLRFAAGALATLYLTNADGRHAVNCFVANITKAIIP